MYDLRPSLREVERAASRLTSANGSRAILFLAADDGAGTSSAALSFARRAEHLAARAVWLVDLDLTRNCLFDAFKTGAAVDAGVVSRPYDASLETPQIYALSPESRMEADARGSSKLLCVHQIGDRRLLVTRFRTERLDEAQRVQFRDSPEWWKAVRSAADWVVVDAPALSRSGAGLTVARHMDGVVLVLTSHQTTAAEALTLRNQVEANGGRVIGIVLNKMDPSLRWWSAGRH